ncbi:MAG: hypothetical protein RLZZ403_1690, partial [Pseudomonadota bacterium]
LLLSLFAGAVTEAAAPVPIDPESWREAERIEFVYTSPGSSTPKVVYLPGTGADRRADERPAIDCPLVSRPASNLSRSRWIWDVADALREPEKFAEAMQHERLTAVYLQVPPDPEAFAPLLDALSRRSIRAYALDGAPDSSDDRSGLLRVLAGVLAFNRRHTTGFAGFEVDVEPYVRPGFSLSEEAHYRRYLDLLAALRAQRPAGFEFSAVIPFWYSQKEVNGESLVAAVLTQVDSLAIMAYRTNPTEIEALSKPTLCYAALAAKPVRIGLESTFLKDEEHYIVSRSRLEPLLIRDGGRWQLPGGPADGAPVDTHYTVRGRNLSFHGDVAGLARQLQRTLPYGAFAGWAVNGPP